MRTQTTDIQRIANIFKVNPDEYLVLKVQDIMKSNENELKKKNFCNNILKTQKDILQAQIHNLKNEFEEKKEYNKALEENHKLRMSIEKYRAVNLRID